MKLFVVALLGLLRVDPSPAADKSNQKPIELHQGVWKPIAAWLNGKRLPKEALDRTTVTIEGSNYTVTVAGEDHDHRGTFSVDTSVKPHRMTIKSHAGSNKGKTILAIFERKPKNAMRVAYDLAGKEFPRVWYTKQDSSYYVVGYRRKKEDAK